MTAFSLQSVPIHLPTVFLTGNEAVSGVHGITFQVSEVCERRHGIKVLVLLNGIPWRGGSNEIHPVFHACLSIG